MKTIRTATAISMMTISTISFSHEAKEIEISHGPTMDKTCLTDRVFNSVSSAFGSMKSGIMSTSDSVSETSSEIWTWIRNDSGDWVVTQKNQIHSVIFREEVPLNK